MNKEKHGIHRIAEMANVSIGTVDRALHGRSGIKEATRKRILQIAQQIGYSPNLAARALSVAKSRVRIGVCIPKEIHFFYDSSGAEFWTRNIIWNNSGSNLKTGPYRRSGKATSRYSSNWWKAG